MHEGIVTFTVSATRRPFAAGGFRRCLPWRRARRWSRPPPPTLRCGAARRRPSSSIRSRDGGSDLVFRRAARGRSSPDRPARDERRSTASTRASSTFARCSAASAARGRRRGRPSRRPPAERGVPALRRRAARGAGRATNGRSSTAARCRGAPPRAGPAARGRGERLADRLRRDDAVDARKLCRPAPRPARCRAAPRPRDRGAAAAQPRPRAAAPGRGPAALRAGQHRGAAALHV